MILIGELSGPELALMAEAQRVVLEFLAKQDDWSDESRETVIEVFKQVATK